MRAGDTVPVPSEYRPRTVEVGTSQEGARFEREGNERATPRVAPATPVVARDGSDFDGTEPVETNRRKPKPAPAENECAACGHVHRHPEYPERKCWARVPRAVGKLGVRARVGRCWCRGEGDAAARKQSNDATRERNRRGMARHRSRRPKETPEQKAARLKRRRELHKARAIRRAPRCLDCGGQASRKSSRGRGALRCDPCGAAHLRARTARKNRARDAARRALAVATPAKCMVCGRAYPRRNGYGPFVGLCSDPCKRVRAAQRYREGRAARCS